MSKFSTDENKVFFSFTVTFVDTLILNKLCDMRFPAMTRYSEKINLVLLASFLLRGSGRGLFQFVPILQR